METANERRRRKLTDLCDRYGVKAVAERAQLSADSLTQIVKGTLLPEKKDGTRSPRSLGDAAAAAIEEALQLGAGWFDADDAGVAAPDFATFEARLQFVREAAGWSAERLQEIAGSGSLKPHDLNGATAVANASGFSVMWLLKGRLPMRSVEREPDDRVSDPIPLGSSRGIPVVGVAKLGRDGFYEELSPIEGAGDGFVPFYGPDKDVYALEVRGQSMHPAIRDTHFVIVSPSRRPKPGSYVLIKTTNGQRMVKELLSMKGGYIQVLSINGNERMSFAPDDIEAVHAVVGMMDPEMWRP